jgi:hypothetical protein
MLRKALPQLAGPHVQGTGAECNMFSVEATRT